MATESEVLHMLTALVLITKPDVVVETGTFTGAGTKAIANALNANERGHLWTVERDPGLAAKFAQMDLDRVTFVTADSLEWSEKEAPAQINFAFVDCSADWTERCKVFSNLLPKMTSGGIICVHDLFFLGENFLDGLCRIALRPPNLVFEALNGIGIWVCE